MDPAAKVADISLVLNNVEIWKHSIVVLTILSFDEPTAVLTPSETDVVDGHNENLVKEG